MHSTEDFLDRIGSLFHTAESSRKGFYIIHYNEDCRGYLFIKNSHVYAGYRWLIALFIYKEKVVDKDVKSKGPRTDPCGIPIEICFAELYVDSI